MAVFMMGIVKRKQTTASELARIRNSQTLCLKPPATSALVLRRNLHDLFAVINLTVLQTYAGSIINACILHCQSGCASASRETKDYTFQY